MEEAFFQRGAQQIEEERAQRYIRDPLIRREAQSHRDASLKVLKWGRGVGMGQRTFGQLGAPCPICFYSKKVLWGRGQRSV